MIPDIQIQDYNYNLSEDRIAKYPLPQRDASKLLVYRGGSVEERRFVDIASILPEGGMMVFNDTKVVPARLFFQKDSGAHIEIFCLQPIAPAEYSTVFASTVSCRWRCVVGNAKKWKQDVIHVYDSTSDPRIGSLNLTATRIEKEAETSIVEFRWEGGKMFSEVLDICGNVPIPPYLNRETEAIDLERYQTTYAKIRGSVAAPTAGLHFTDRELDQIRSKNIDIENVCLHVGAGTFLPVKSDNVADHPMHKEPFVVSLELLKKLKEKKGDLIAVGTTSVRTLESLYYVGVSCIEEGHPVEVRQWAPYDREYDYSLEEALSAIIEYLEVSKLKELKITTRIIIVPGFAFKLVDAVVTNFHQPQSTLILLVSALVNGDWKTIYDYALKNDFRFLSYGDSSLLFRAKE